MLLQIDSSSGLSWGTSGDNRIIQNVINLLNTNIYEVAYMRLMGLSKLFIDKPISEIEGILTSEILDLISTYEPRAKVLDVKILDYDKVSEHLNIKVVIDV